MHNVSVALCTYNGSRFISRQLVSILNQTVIPNQIVICDDSSQDNTVDLCRSIFSQYNYPAEIYVNQKNLGFTKNFEKALQHCQGDIIFLADQDDYWYSNKIEQMLIFFDRFADVFGFTHEGRIVDEQGLWHGTYKNRQIADGYGAHDKAITGALSAIKAESLNWLLPIPNGIKGHDVWMSYVFSFMPSSWMFVDDVLVDIYRHSSNESEWVVNSFHSIGRLDVLRQQCLSPPAYGYSDRIEMNKIMVQRLMADKANLMNLSPSEKKIIMNKLALERNALNSREKLVNDVNRLSRIYQAFKLFLRGDYKYFNGTRSFVRDLSR